MNYAKGCLSNKAFFLTKGANGLQVLLKLVMSYCALHRKDSHWAHVCGFCISRKGGTGGSGWGHPNCAVHMAAPRLERVMGGTGWANSHSSSVNRLRKGYFHLLGVPFGQGRLSEQVFAKRGC